MQLVLDTPGLELLKKDRTLLIKGEQSSRVISPAKLTSIAITAKVILHTDAVVLCVKNQIPILFFDRIGRANARVWSPYFESIATLRRYQVKFGEGVEASSWMVDLFLLKAEEQIENLRWLNARSNRAGLETAIKQIRQQSKAFEGFRDQLLDECSSRMMGVEGAIARVYWQSLGSSLPRQYTFSKRSRQPAEDVFNAALNYLYGMLYAVVEAGLFAAGLDPHLGILHADEYNKPTLSFDLIESFRPWIDRLLMEECLKDSIKTAFFTQNQHGIFLNKEGKAFFIPLFNDFLRSERKYFERQATVRNHVYFLAAQLARRIRTLMEA